MSDDVSVSILIPVYNVAPYLRQCLDSVVRQTLQGIEIICINDGSTDESRDIIEEYKNNYPFLHVIDKPNSGYGHSLNVGIDASKGKYIGIVESDDFIDPQMFLRLFEQAEFYQAEVVKSNFYNFRQDQGNEFFEMLAPCPYGQLFEPADIPQMFFGEIYVWTGLYKREFLQKKNIRFNETPGASYQDVGFSFKVYAAARHMLALHEGYYHYRRDNITSSIFSTGKVFCVCDEFQEINRYLQQYPSLRKKVQDIVPYMQYRRYMPTFGRIAYRYKTAFLERMIKEFDELKTEGRLQPDNWLHDDWQTLSELRTTYAELCAEEQGMRWHLSGLKNDVSSAEKLYIYGAGKIGNEIAEGLAAIGIKFYGFVVTSAEGNAERIGDIPIVLLDNVADVSRQAFIVAVKQKWQFEVVENLKKHQATNIIIINDILRKYLRQTTNKKYEGFGF